MAVGRQTRGFSSLLLSLSHLLALAAVATDTFGKGRNITDGETLVSANGTFTLGFFSPGVSTGRYLGIWFTVSGEVVCWVANRERPLNSTSGYLQFNTTGSLSLVDGSSGEIIWSSNSSAADPAVAQLLESGNLAILDESNGMIKWQSFEHPSNTLLPGMKMGRLNWSGADLYLTPWRSEDDPSPGTYRHVTELNGLLENVLWDGRIMVYRTGAWNGERFSGVTEASTYTDKFTFEVTMTPWEVTFGYIAKPGAPLSYIVVTHDGFVKRQVWEASKTKWLTYYQGPRDICDSYAKCGPFGLCNANAPSTSFCSCIKGFSPRFPSEWNAKETSGGCQRNVPLGCVKTNGSSTDGFFVLQGIKLPDARNASVDPSISLGECGARCLADCSCVAYAPTDIHGGGPGRGCIVWTDKLVDLRYVDGGQELYLKLARSELGRSTHGNKRSLIIAVTSVVSVLAFLMFCGVMIKMKIRRNITGRTPTVPHIELPISSNLPVPSVSLAETKKATKNFSRKKLIGKGGFGSVYEGKLPKGHHILRGSRHRTVAVKRMHSQSLLREDVREKIPGWFDREIELMSQLRQHDNVARLLGFCIEGDERIMLYEYAHRRSLDDYIFAKRKKRKQQLTWKMRLEIILGIAEGLAHLHEGANNNVIHRDLKPANILLDDKWVAKVGDFGTAKIFVANETGTWTVIGSEGYIAPEYERYGGDMTLKCDVYSFGVTLLEVINGKRNLVERNVLRSARRLWSQHNIMALLDRAIDPLPNSDDELLNEVRRCIQIGLLCVQEIPEQRPTMPEVVQMLATSSLQLPVPIIPVVNGGISVILPVPGEGPLIQETSQPLEEGGDMQAQVTQEITEVP